jgi:hypothetical protein
MRTVTASSFFLFLFFIASCSSPRKGKEQEQDKNQTSSIPKNYRSIIEHDAPAFLENAFTENFAHKNSDEDSSYVFYMENPGMLDIPTGKIIVCDPFLFNGDAALATEFPKGRFPVELAIAKTGSGGDRIAFVRIKFSEEIPLYWKMAYDEGADTSTLEEGSILGYGVDAGTGCFMDSSFSKTFSDYLMKDGNYEKISAELDKTYKHTRSWLLWGNNPSKVALFSSGWGDGFYASYIGYDKNNKICRLVTDFGVLEWSHK